MSYTQEQKDAMNDAVSNHSLTETEFNALKAAYYDSQTPPDPKPMSRAQVESLIGSIPVGGGYIQYDLHEEDLSTHNNMTLDSFTGDPSIDPNVNQFYSITLFRGLLEGYKSTTGFGFVRMKEKRNQNPSMGILLYVGTTPIFWGDLSSDYP